MCFIVFIDALTGAQSHSVKGLWCIAKKCMTKVNKALL